MVIVHQLYSAIDQHRTRARADVVFQTIAANRATCDLQLARLSGSAERRTITGRIDKRTRRLRKTSYWGRDKGDHVNGRRDCSHASQLSFCRLMGGFPSA